MVSESLDLSDVGMVVAATNYNTADTSNYLFDEDDEKIFFLIRSNQSEYCFTNLALIHIDCKLTISNKIAVKVQDDSAIPSKKFVKRYEYSTHKISQVSLVNNATADLDGEFHFVLEGIGSFCISLERQYINALKGLYKVLITISKIQGKEKIARENALLCIESLSLMYKIDKTESEEMIVAHYNAILNNLNSTILDQYTQQDFSSIFEKYIRND
jgi:Bacterial PH domain/YvbH-like oligomerisation region